jgi:hypothetical protein
MIRIVRFVPWLLFAISASTYLAANVLARSAGLSLVRRGEELQFGVILAAFLAYAVVGAVVASRRPANHVGWLLCGMGVVAQIQGLASAAAWAAHSPSGPALPAWMLDPWVMAPLLNLWTVSFSAVGLLLFIFPNGQLLSSGSRTGLVLAAVTVVVGVVSSGSGAGPTAMRFPLFETLVSEPTASELYDLGQGVSGISLMALLALGAVSLVVRLRRARGIERQQMKWFAYAAVLLATVFVLTAVAFFSPLRALDPSARIPPAMFGGVPFLLALVAVPLGAGIAILRYRLYDIDVLINRTLVYGGLTATLGAAYVGSVLFLQTLLRPFTGGSDIAVAVSTLAVVALFQPVRARIQRAVDRRFYRARYDAQRTLDVFAGRLRDEVDLDDLEREIVTVVDRTVHPAHTSVWLRRG